MIIQPQKERNSFFFKMLLCMKIYLVLSLFSIVLATGKPVFGQKINLKMEKATLEKVLGEISQQAGLDLMYNNEIFKNARKIERLEFKNADLVASLNRLFEGGQYEFEISENTIVVRLSSTIKKDNISYGDFVQRRTISGMVSNSKGEAIANVNITATGDETITSSDKDGHFKIMVNASTKQLSFSLIGFETQTVQIGNNSNLNIVLIEKIAYLDQAVVIGYGTVKKKDLTGAVSSIKMEDMPTGTVSSISQLLAGKAAGLRAVQNSAQVGGAVSLKIRGEGSIDAGNEPLVVIDGFPVYQTPQLSSGNRYNSGSLDNILSTINPNDIESIEVLKDASSTAIYGSRAGHGVILVTTKRGTESKPSIQYTSNFSTQRMKRGYDILGPKEFMEQRNRYGFEEYLKENGLSIYKDYINKPSDYLPPIYTPYYTDEEIVNKNGGTDWFKEVTRVGFLQNHDLSMRGGSSNTNYLASLGVLEHKGIIRNNNMNRYTLRLNIDQEISKRVRSGLSINLSQNKYSNVPIGEGEWENAGIISSAVRFSPLIPVRNGDGTFALNPNVPQLPNPVSLLDIEDNTVNDRALINGFVSFQPIESLIFKVNMGIDKPMSKRKNFLPRTTKYGAAVNGQASISEVRQLSKLMELTGSYRKEIGRHRFDALLGYSFQSLQTEGFSAGNQDFVIGEFSYNNLAAGSFPKPSVGSNAAKSGLGSYFGRLNYSFSGRYILTATVRADGDSNFSKENRWGYFPSMALAWRFVDEPFIKKLNQILSDGKLRLSYGQTGNSNIGFKIMNLYNLSDEYNFVFGNEGNMGVLYSQIGNPNLKWETTTEANIGLDLGFWGNRINLTAEYFNRTISDLLGSAPLPFYHVVSSFSANLGKTQSQGIEVTLKTKNLVKPRFSWTSDITLSNYRDRWKERSIYWVKPVYAEADQAIRANYSMVADGLLQAGEKAPEWQPGLLPGQVKLKDLNGDKKLDDNDVRYFGNTDPRLIFGVNNTFTYKNFDFNIYLYGETGRLRAPSYYLNWATSSIKDEVNVSSNIKNTWGVDNPYSNIPSALPSIYGKGNYMFKENAYFLRCRNITMGYQINNTLFKKVRVYADVNNPFVLTNWDGVDPEVSGQYTYPNVVSYNLGLEINF